MNAERISVKKINELPKQESFISTPIKWGLCIMVIMPNSMRLGVWN